VKDYVASLSGKLRLFFLPPYSPELNPDEQVWNYLKLEPNEKIKRGQIKLTEVGALAENLYKIVSS
jgi:transposase